MTPNKAMSVRLPDAMNTQIRAPARIEGVRVSELVRAALEDYLSRRRFDEKLKERLKQRMEEDWAVLKLLGKEDMG